MDCLKCKEDVSELVNYDTLALDHIKCPYCENKMKVEYDETWDGEEEQVYWWLVPYDELK